MWVIQASVTQQSQWAYPTITLCRAVSALALKHGGTGKRCEGRSNAQTRGEKNGIRDDTRGIIFYVQHSETHMRHARVWQQSPRAYLTSTRRVVSALVHVRHDSAVTRERGDSRWPQWPRRFSEQCHREEENKYRNYEYKYCNIRVVPDEHSILYFGSLLPGV